MVEGRATAEGTSAFAAAHPAAPGFWRQAQGLTLAGVGMGTYLGGTDRAARAAYVDAAREYLQRGNVLDTAANYRDQASERDLGEALRRHLADGGDRSGVFVATKAGFLHGDCDEPDPRGWFRRTYLGDPPALQQEDLASGHSLSPAFLRTQVARSRANLGLGTVDALLLHNVEHPLEQGLDEPSFYAKVEEAFVELEETVDRGHIASYGVATWNGLRRAPGSRGHLQLVKLVHHAGQARRRAGGRASDHHLRVVELPVNLGMPEAAAEPTQPWRFGAQPPLACLQDLGMVALASASLLQMRMAGRIPRAVRERLGGRSDAEVALRFTRSLPGVTSALVGMGRPEHVRENLEAAMAAPPAADPLGALAAGRGAAPF